MGQEFRITSFVVSIKENDKILTEEDGTVKDSLFLTNSGFHLHIFFDSQLALDNFREGVNKLILPNKD